MTKKALLAYVITGFVCIIMLTTALIIFTGKDSRDGKIAFIVNDKLEFMNYADIEFHTVGEDFMINQVGNGVQMIGPSTIKIMESTEPQEFVQVRFYHNGEQLPVNVEWETFNFIVPQMMNAFISIPSDQTDGNDPTTLPFVLITNSFNIEFYLDGESL